MAEETKEEAATTAGEQAAEATEARADERWPFTRPGPTVVDVRGVRVMIHGAAQGCGW